MKVDIQKLISSIALIGVAALISGQCEAQRGSASYVSQLNRGREALSQKRWRSAESHFRYALVWASRGVEAYSGLGYVYLHIGEKQRAIDEFNAALKIKPHFADAERGIHQARSEGEEESAFHSLEEQVKQEPNNADLHATFAEELLERDRVDDAQREADMALKIVPNMGHAYCALGRVALKRNNVAEAQRLLEIALKRDSSDDDALTALGDLAMTQKDFQLATKRYKRVVEVVPEQIEGHTKLMGALTALGDERGVAKEKITLARLTP